MIVLRTIEYEQIDATKVFKNLKWAVKIKSELGAWYNWLSRDNFKPEGYFSPDKYYFIINPLLEYWISNNYSFILARGEVKDSSTIKVKFELSGTGIFALIFNVWIGLFLMMVPINDPGSKLFILVMILVLCWNLYRIHRHLVKVEGILTRMIQTAGDYYDNSEPG